MEPEIECLPIKHYNHHVRTSSLTGETHISILPHYDSLEMYLHTGPRHLKLVNNQTKTPIIYQLNYGMCEVTKKVE